MSYAVANGALGKSPLIDKINQLPVEQITDRVTGQMESHIFGHKEPVCPPISCSFNTCQTEMKRLLES